MKVIIKVNGLAKIHFVKLASTLIVVGFVVCAGSGFAQTLSMQSGSTIGTAQPDSIVSIVAEQQGLAQVDPVDLPIMSGTFWWVMPGATAVPAPCPPLDLSETVYQIADGQFLVDETGGQVVANTPRFGLQAQATSSTVASEVASQVDALVNLITQVQTTAANQQMRTSMQAMGMDVPSPGDGGSDGGTNGYFTPNFTTPNYGTNLWIRLDGISGGNLVGIISNTVPSVFFDLQIKSDLMQPDWISSGWGVYGSQTNWTPFSLPMSSSSNLFVRARSWADDGSGLPIWWQMQYFGTVGIDPSALDLSGDGLTLWQDFEEGLAPGVFSGPPAPQGLTATINPSTSTVTLAWVPANGAVTGYTIYLSGPNQYITVGVTNQFVDTTYPAYSATGYNWNYPAYYMIQANYAQGSSAWSDAAFPYSLSGVPNAQALLASDGSIKFAVANIPAGASQLKLTRMDWNDFYSLGGTTNFLVSASSFANGLYTLPANMTGFGPLQSDWYVQTVWPNNSQSAATYAGSFATPSGYLYANLPGLFCDGRTQLVQNVTFLLRSASLTGPISYDVDGVSASQPTNYTYASYYFVDNNNTFNELGDASWPDVNRPFDENYLYRNFLYINNTNLYSSGFLNTGYSVRGDGGYSLSQDCVFQFDPPTNSITIPALDQSTWMQPYTDYNRLGMSINGSGQFVLPNSIYNYFGLHLSKVLLAHNHGGTLYLDTLNANGTWPQTNDTYYFYPQFDQPQLQTVGYIFGRSQNPYNNGFQLPGDPMPGNSSFSPTNGQPLMIAAVGQLFQAAAFAEQLIQNGDASKPVYVAQYFDKAYKVDTNGNVTSTQTGILSPYGAFFPTEPGPTALVTMPDINTGQRGTGIVQVVSLQLDANHDGSMNLSYFGQDYVPGYPPFFLGEFITFPQPFKFWINNGYIQPGTGANLDQDKPIYPSQVNYSTTNTQPNYVYAQIRCQRNLENFARLWICGLPQLPPSEGYTVTLGFDINAPAGGKINLYPAYEADGGTRYLTATNVAAAQVGGIYGTQLAQIGFTAFGQGYTLPVDGFGNPSFTHFLFEGTSPGPGNLLLTISQNGQVIIQTSVYMELHDIKDLYEQAQVTNAIQTWPEMVQQQADSGFQVLNSPPASAFEAQQLAVFVHGWRMTQWDWQDFSDTMFKRLYWQGFKGRFASLRWPTRSADTDTNNVLGIPADKLTFNRSEYIAFESGTGAALYFDNLRSRYTNYTISACAHSQGNIVMMEALKELAAVNQSPLDNYTMMQAAVPAHCYDTTVTNLPSMLAAEADIPTPNTYANYAAGANNALRGKIINFFNPIDFALATGSNTLFTLPIFGSISMSTSWEGNESAIFMKPLVLFGYTYNPTNHAAVVTTNFFTEIFNVTNLQSRVVTDPPELMPFVARPRSKAVGAQGGVGNVVNGGQLDLTSLGFTALDYDHSGEFNRNIQTPQVQIFYTNLVFNMFPPF